MRKDIKNIIFDMGGVLVGLDAARCAAAFREIGCGKIVAYVEEHRTEDLFLDTELGRIDTHAFCDEVRRICCSDTSDERIVWAWNELLVATPKEKLSRLAKLKEQGYRLFLLSNTNAMHWQRCRDDFFTADGLSADDYFERVFLSFEMHLAKPSPGIFLEALREADIDAASTLFIDDSEVNCRAAESVGINALVENTGHRWLYEI